MISNELLSIAENYAALTVIHHLGDEEPQNVQRFCST